MQMASSGKKDEPFVCKIFTHTFDTFVFCYHTVLGSNPSKKKDRWGLLQSRSHVKISGEYLAVLW